jgi:hypothetical protein
MPLPIVFIRTPVSEEMPQRRCATATAEACNALWAVLVTTARTEHRREYRRKPIPALIAVHGFAHMSTSCFEGEG